MPPPAMLGELFDPQGALGISEHFRPHWSQAGAVVFITFRTADSIPLEVLRRWERDKQAWLLQHGCPAERHWSEIVPTLDAQLQRSFKKDFDRCREDFLDTGRGECLLRDRDLAQIVADSLMHFDGQRYRMGDFVIMPNHVHLLAAFACEESLKKQCGSWLHYSATQINRKLGREGKFWQQEPFDHLVRNPAQYEYLRAYIRDNGIKAHLPQDAYLYRQFTGR
jgi:type I restriction enzyme R subunit